MKASDYAVLGRPREFDTEDALAAALKVFWRKGYDGASLTELTEAMGITRPSLYGAFGNKEALFRKALDLYEREKLAFFGEALNAPTAYAVAERLLTGGCEAYTGDSETPGCMGVNSVLSCGGIASDSVRQELLSLKLRVESQLRERFERAQAEGDLASNCDVVGLTYYVLTLSQGMALQASTGVGREALQRVIATALAAWPCGREEAAPAR
jgi:AcrR family transcriptional regulator